MGLHIAVSSQIGREYGRRNLLQLLVYFLLPDFVSDNEIWLQARDHLDIRLQLVGGDGLVVSLFVDFCR